MISVAPIPPFDPAALESVVEAFRGLPKVELTQAWRNEVESEFEPAWAQLGWRDDLFLIFAELSDRDIFNRAQRLNEKTWLLGDVLEIFVQREHDAAYFEYHVTPENQRLQLKFASAAPGQGLTFLDDPALLTSRTWIFPEQKRWCVFAQISGQSLGVTKGSLAGEKWKFSLGRYDYTRGREEPVISSSSLHREPYFHRLHEWELLSFREALSANSG
jgi:hypothetical protein